MTRRLTLFVRCVMQMAADVDMLLAATARACAHGHKQLSLVNELLGWTEVAIDDAYVPEARSRVALYGETQLRSSSWYNLRRRLTLSGFVIVRRTDGSKRSVRLAHPARS